MKKKILLTITAFTIAGFTCQPLAAHAASQSGSVKLPDGKRVLFSYGTICNKEDISDILQNCFPGITLPGCGTPEQNKPENNLPDTNTPGTNTPETESPENSTHAYIKQVVDLVNTERAKAGLAALTIDTKVQAAAQIRAKECEQRFSHTRPDGSSFSTALKEQNVSYRSAGENIAWGQRSPEEVMKGWMNSEGHRANIMNPNFTTIGVGYYQNANGTNYWCQLFTR